MKVAIYARVSTRDKDQTPETQLYFLREHATQRGWEMVREYVDQASATDLRGRTAWRELLEQVRKGGIDLVLVLKLDRAFRSAKDTYDGLAYLDNYNVGFVAATQPIDTTTATGKLLLGFGAILLFLVLLRLFSIAWYLVRYRGFTLRQTGQDLRAEYGLLTQVSSLIPVHRIQLVTVSASLLHRCFGRTSIDLETAGSSDAGSELSGQLAASGMNTTRQWLAPIVESGRAAGLLRKVLPEVDIDTVEWKPIEARAVRRIVNRVAIAVTPFTIGLAAVLTFSPIPLSGWHALWLPSVALTTAWLLTRRWVRRAGYALTECAIYFRSGWLSRQISVVRFVNMQTVSMHQSPFDHRKRMASVAVDTAGAGGTGHRIRIPFLDVDVAESILHRLYVETRSTEFRW